MRKNHVLFFKVALILAIAVSLASVFAYYPLNFTALPQPPPVVFEPGSNANQPDLVGKTIAVTIGANGTSASVSVNPTYQETYYKDVLRIRNTGRQTVEVYFLFTSVSNNLPPDSTVKLFLYSGDMKITELDASSPPINQPVRIGTLGMNQLFELDIYIYIPEGTLIEGASYTASIRLAYTPAPAPKLRVVFAEGEGSGAPVILDDTMYGVAKADVYDNGSSVIITANIYSLVLPELDGFGWWLDFYNIVSIVNNEDIPAFVYLKVTGFESTLPADAKVQLEIWHPLIGYRVFELNEDTVGTVIPYGVILPGEIHQDKISILSPYNVSDSGAQVNISLTLIAEPYILPEEDEMPWCQDMWFWTLFDDPSVLDELSILGGSWYVENGFLIGIDDDTGPGRASYIYLPIDMRGCERYLAEVDFIVQDYPVGIVFLSNELDALYTVVVNTSGIYILSYNDVTPGNWYLHEYIPIELPEGILARFHVYVWSPTPWYKLIESALAYVDESGFHHYFHSIEIIRPTSFRTAYAGLIILDRRGEFDYLSISTLIPS